MDYVKYIRDMVGHKRILMNFAVAAVFNEKEELLLQKRGDKKKMGTSWWCVGTWGNFREVMEETGLKVITKHLIGIYTGPKYNVYYPNGDESQPVAVLFKTEIVGGKLRESYDEETLELGYFTKDNLPEIANKDFEDMISDAFANKKGIWH